MRILQVAHAYPPVVGGVETYLSALRGWLNKRGHSAMVLAGGHGSGSNESESDVIISPFLSREYLLAARSLSSKGGHSSTLVDELVGILDSLSVSSVFSVVHVHNAHHFGPELATALFTKVQPSRLINTVHDRIGEYLHPEVLAMPWARTLFVSKFLLSNMPPATNPQLHYLGLDYEVLLGSAESNRTLSVLEHPLIFVPARLLPWKGQAVAVRAFSEVRRILGSGTLVLCGSEQLSDGAAVVREYRAELEAEASQLGIRSAVKFMSFPIEGIGAAYRACDVVWCPTVAEEPFGLIPLEAMALGVPVIASASGGMKETVVNYETGIVVRRADAADLASATVKLLHNEELRRKIISAGRRRAREFSIEAHIDSLESIYSQVAHGGVESR